MLVLCGIAIIVLGFTLRANPLLVIAIAAIATGLAAGLSPVDCVTALGKAFKDNRMMAIAWFMLPVIGILERGGLKERARHLIAKIQAATAGRILFAYFLVRQGTAMLGLISLGGHVQMVRPLIAPMTEAAAERQGPLSEETRETLRANAAAVDNIAVCFGEDVFVAVGSILLILGFMAPYGYNLTPFSVAVWAIPTALLALIIHGLRLWRLDIRLKERPDHGQS
ncbi:MAG: DUF969 domain-containing protein [Asticcacaulis sp.]|uniref:DUF969 domain-containing protein n=1 Tax=Asticcacaulis sp. TaxID=1872648 RepID=UPI0039E6E51F